jgi:hypothetical protein
MHSDRSAEGWEEFCQESNGPDVGVLGASNRLDIVVRNREVGSVGIEVKCLGASRHAGKLTQALGQAVLGLANRDERSYSFTVELSVRPSGLSFETLEIGSATTPGLDWLFRAIARSAA